MVQPCRDYRAHHGLCAYAGNTNRAGVAAKPANNKLFRKLKRSW
jgi:hypothetical protein